MSKPFFFRITAADLLDFATDPDGHSMTLLQFAKELQKGKSDIPFIQSVIDEANVYIEKKRASGSSGGKAKASTVKANCSTAIAPLENALANSSNDVANPSAPLARSSNSNKSIKDKKTADFEGFWDAFGYKQGKGGAEKAWLAIKDYTPELYEKIIKAAKSEAQNRPALLTNNRTPKWAQGWITERRWEDEPPSVQLAVTVVPAESAEDRYRAMGLL